MQHDETDMPRESDTPLESGSEGSTPSRRAALARLGLGVAFAYSAPVILKIDRESSALAATPCPGKGKGKSNAYGHCKKDKKNR